MPSTEELVKTKDVDTEDVRRQAKLTKVKSVTWVLQGTAKAMSARTAKAAKAMPRVTLTRSNWRVWDPGRSEAHVVLRGVIVRNGNHDSMPARHHVPSHTYVGLRVV